MSGLDLGENGQPREKSNPRGCAKSITTGMCQVDKHMLRILSLKMEGLTVLVIDL